MFNLLLISLIFSIGATITGCASSRTSESMVQISHQEASSFARSLIGKRAEVIMNSDSTYFLAKRADNYTTEFAVSDLNKKIVLERQRIKGTVKWNNVHSLSIIKYPGALEDRRSDTNDLVEIIELTTSH